MGSGDDERECGVSLLRALWAYAGEWVLVGATMVAFSVVLWPLLVFFAAGGWRGMTYLTLRVVLAWWAAVYALGIAAVVTAAQRGVG